MIVKVFSTPTCPFCVTVKDFLKENNIEFEDLDVAENEIARNEMVEKSGQMGVPVIMVDEEIVIGFDQAKLKKLLNIK